MKTRIAMFLAAVAAFALRAPADTLPASGPEGSIQWKSAKVTVSTDQVLSIEVTVKVHVRVKKAVVVMILENWEKQASLDKLNEPRIIVPRGDKTLVLKRSLALPKGISSLDVYTQLVVDDTGAIYIAQRGRVTITRSDDGKTRAVMALPDSLPE